MANNETEANTMKYMIASIDGKDIFLHEAIWVLNSSKPIPSGMLVAHKDGDTMNNEYDNLYLVSENNNHGDLHIDSNKIFHQEKYKENRDYIRKHFSDIASILFQ